MRVVSKILQVQLFAFFLLLFCTVVAGEMNGVVWFMFIAEALLGLLIAGAIIQHRQRRSAGSSPHQSQRE